MDHYKSNHFVSCIAQKQTQVIKLGPTAMSSQHEILQILCYCLWFSLRHDGLNGHYLLGSRNLIYVVKLLGWPYTRGIIAIPDLNLGKLHFGEVK